MLFGGQDTLSRLLADGIAAAPEPATPLEAVTAGLDAATAFFTPAQREWGPRLRAVVAANSELRERAAAKRDGLALAMTEALQKRGVPDPASTLAAQLGALAFERAFERWTEPASEQTFTDLARQALHELQATAATLR